MKNETRDELIERLIDEAELTVGGWTEAGIKGFLDYADSYISDWYGSEHNLTNEEIDIIAGTVADFFRD